MWGATITHSAILVATATAICADSLVLKVRAQQVRGARTLCGGSDLDDSVLAALIVSVILERPTCLLCIALARSATRNDVVAGAAAVVLGLVLYFFRRPPLPPIPDPEVSAASPAAS